MLITFADVQKYLKQDRAGMPRISVALLGDFATQLLAIALEGIAVKEGLDLSIREGAFNAIVQEITDSHGLVATQKPDVVIIAFTAEELQQQFYDSGTAAQEQFAAAFLQQAEALRNSLLLRQPSVQVIFANLAEIPDGIFGRYANRTPRSFLWQTRQINAGLMMLAAAHASDIADVSMCQQLLGRRVSFSPATWLNSSMSFSPEALLALAYSI